MAIATQGERRAREQWRRGAFQYSRALQVHCFRVGDTYVTGPLPEATEPARIDDDLLDALKKIGKT